MLPLTLLAASKVSSLLTDNNALQQAVSALGSLYGVTLPAIAASDIVVSSLGQDLADQNAQLSFPRVCSYTTQVKNTQSMKFRSFSGSALVASDIWFSADLLADTDTGLHYYLEAITAILRANVGDWGDGFYFSGIYDSQLQPPKPGGFGFLEMARVTCSLDVNLN
jgi:hypothetical protein